MSDPHPKSKFRGVYYNRPRNNWRAQIFASGAPRYVGTYLHELDAAVAYDHALWRLLPYCKRNAAQPNFPATFGSITKADVNKICPGIEQLAKDLAYINSAELSTPYTEADEDLAREAFMLRRHIPRTAPILANTDQDAIRSIRSLVRAVQVRAVSFALALESQRNLIQHEVNQLPTANLEGLQSQCNSVLANIDATRASLQALHDDLASAQIVMESQLLAGLIPVVPVPSAPTNPHE